MNKKKIIYSIFAVLILSTIILGVNVYKTIKTQLLNYKYMVLNFESEDEMLEIIRGTWTLYSLYSYFDSGYCVEWSDTRAPQIKNITLDYENGKIVFDNGQYYDVIMFEGDIYVRITPKAKNEESYYLFSKCNEPVPDMK